MFTNPLTLDYLEEYEEIANDNYLVPGFQASTIPLGENVFLK